jgi:uncharacterized membrane protein YhaH (DUF805 family)
MATKKELLKNLRSYTPEEIAEAVKDGTVTLYELAKESEGAFTPLLRKQVKEILDRPIPETSNTDQSLEKTEDDKVSAPTKELELPSTDIIQMDSIESPVDTIDETVPESDNSTILQDDVVDNRGMFKRPFNFFTGRIRRMEYWLSLIILYAYAFVIGLIVGASRWPEGVLYILLIPGYWFIWAQGSKRCHDRGNSGWYQLIPFYGLWMAFADGEPGENEYGTNPKE